jgi:hypothetical protein
MRREIGRVRPNGPRTPARVFCALAASASGEADWSALRWLESLPAPQVDADPADRVGSGRSSGYVVTNTLAAKGGSQARAQQRPAHQGPRGACHRRVRGHLADGRSKAHLSDPFLFTLRDIQRLEPAGTGQPPVIVAMSASPGNSPLDAHAITSADEQHPIAGPRLIAAKRLHLVTVPVAAPPGPGCGWNGRTGTRS